MITRFAPSPTGKLHLGGARTALFNFLLARHNGGQFVLRIEDTDTARSKSENVTSILGALQWLGLEWDGQPVFQTARTELYQQYADKLVDQGLAYWCHCSQEKIDATRAQLLAEGQKPRYDRTCRELNLGPAPGATIRFKTPLEGSIGWTDLVKGPIVIDSQELDDLVIFKSDGQPTYNFAVVVDDMTMGITDIIRGDDHVNNTPRQILFYQAFGHPLPAFGHLPMILGADKAPLSKRHGATSVMAFKALGYLPEAIINCLARLGWSHGDQEIFSLDELIKYFDLAHVGKSGAVFNQDKLLSLNAHYIKQTDPAALAEIMWPYLEDKGYTRPAGDMLTKMAKSVQIRGKTAVELADLSEFYLKTRIRSTDYALVRKTLTSQGMEVLKEASEALLHQPDIDHEGFEAILKKLSEKLEISIGAVARPIRLALTGSMASPPLFEIIKILGPETVQSRLLAAGH
ncbi:MAG: glutamate--tRNA ligase [Deltaproteobacteria bacterium]|jgi:glutamyl-tRNA synthetase|nr:glutamate--tRNA ligase [Deltaproteobacteria bacterium]